jgi:hypothetical protein
VSGDGNDLARVVWNRILLDNRMTLPDDVRHRINELFEEAIGDPIPSRQPSDAAVEAAAQAIYACPPGRRQIPWASVSNGPARDEFLRAARSALEAAYRVDAPRPLLDREAVAARLLYEEGSEWAEGTDRHYELADAVMELARPMPTQEQVEAALEEHGVLLFDPQPQCRCGHVYDKLHLGGVSWKDQSLHRADAVLALLSGAEL